MSRHLLVAVAAGFLGTGVLPALAVNTIGTGLERNTHGPGALGVHTMWPFKAKAHLVAENAGTDSIHPRAKAYIAEVAAGKEVPGRAILRYLMDVEGRDHKTVLSGLGALAGFSAQMAIRKGLVATGRRKEGDVLVRAEAKTGDVYYYGDMINWMVAEHEKSSIWAVVREGAVKAGATPQSLPDLIPIFERTAAALGTPQFGTPEVAAKYPSPVSPRALVDRHWAAVHAMLVADKVDPESWAVFVAFAAKVAIAAAADEIPPGEAAHILMESAIPMSKIDYAKVPGA